MDPFKKFRIPGLPPGFGGGLDLSQQAMTQVRSEGGVFLIVSLTEHPEGWLLVNRASGGAWFFLQQIDAITFAEEHKIRDLAMHKVKAGEDLGRHLP